MNLLEDRGAPSEPGAPRAAPRRRVRERLLAHFDASGTHATWVLWAALAGMFATTFPITILTVSLPSIAREFGARETTMAWVISAPMLFSAVALPLLGKLGDLYGHRRVFLLGTAGSTAIAFATAFAWDPASLISLRTLAAVLGGATQPTAMALIFGITEPSRRVRAMGWWSMTGAAAPALGLAVGGPLVDFLGWRVVFVMQGAFTLLAFALAALVLRETPRQSARFDVAGAVALAFGVGGCMLALGSVRQLGAGSPVVAGSLLVGVVALVGFIAIERRVAAPLMPLGLFADRRFTAPILSNSFMSASYMGAFVIAPLMLQASFSLSISLASAILLLRTMSLTLASPAGGVLGMRIGERGAAVVGCVVMTAAMAVLWWGVAGGIFAAVAIGLVLQGLGHGLGLPALTSSAASAAAESDLGIASAVNRLTASVGAAFGITLLMLIYGGNATPSSFAAAFAAGGLLGLLSLIAALAMRPSKK
jgi:MFS family permease